MGRKGGIKYQVSQIINEHKGLGQSKMESRNTSGLQGENGHNVSDKFHSYRSIDHARANLINLGNYAKSEFGIKDMSKIDAEVVKSWIESKDLSYRSARSTITTQIFAYYFGSSMGSKEKTQALVKGLK
jgi:hypothetical protein